MTLLANFEDKTNLEDKLMTLAESINREGIKRGIALGMELGKTIRLQTIAQRMLEMGIDLNVISEATELSKKTLKALKANLEALKADELDCE
jgi:predicted transposase YdaD